MYMNVFVVNWGVVVSSVILQGVDLNKLPPVDDSSAPGHTSTVMCPTATRDYQIALIEMQGPNSRGVRLLRVGLAAIGKTYESSCQSTNNACSITAVNGVDSNTCNIVEDSTLPRATMRTAHPAATREYQIFLIEAQGPNSRALRLLRAGLPDYVRNYRTSGPDSL